MTARGTAAVIVTHDERITHHADRVVRIVDGKIADDDADPHDEPEVSIQRADSRDGPTRARNATDLIATRGETMIESEPEERLSCEATADKLQARADDRARPHEE